MLSLFSIVGLALYAQTITSLPTSPLSNDAGLSAHRGLDPNQFSTIDSDAGALFPSLDASSSDDAEALLSPQLALSVGSSASAPPLASQDLLDRGCDKAPKAKGKRNTGGADTSFCPAYLTNPVTPGAVQGAPQKKPEGQQQQNFAPQEPKIATPRKPESRGDVRLTPSDEPVRNPFGEKDKDPQCPRRYKYTVCGISDLRYLNLVASLTIYDADLLINSGFGFGMVIRPGKQKTPFFRLLLQQIPPSFLFHFD